MIRIIVCGSREFENYDALEKYLNEQLKDYNPNDIEIVSGHARGVDKMGEIYAAKHGIKFTIFPAKWDKYGRSAGMIRNSQMLDYIQKRGHQPKVIAFWNGISRGTAHMIYYATKENVPVSIYKF